MYWKIDENSIYIGILPSILFLFFYIKNSKGIKHNLTLIITMLIIFWMMLGIGIYPSLYEGIKHLPVFLSFRVAQRFRFDLIIPLALLIGLGMDNAVRLLQTDKLARPLSILCLAVIFIDLTVFSTTNFLSQTLIINNLESSLPREAAFTQTLGKSPPFEIQRTIPLASNTTPAPLSFEYVKIRQNEGVIKCKDETTRGVEVVANGDKNYLGEYHLPEPDKRIKVENTFWSPNRLVYKIANQGLAVNNLLIINQNYYPGWITIRDGAPCVKTISNNGLLAAKLEFSTQKITLEFNPFKYYLVCK
jgi:hypothetical protein